VHSSEVDEGSTLGVELRAALLPLRGGGSMWLLSLAQAREPV
jgi:hypothetical protein